MDLVVAILADGKQQQQLAPLTRLVLRDRPDGPGEIQAATGCHVSVEPVFEPPHRRQLRLVNLGQTVELPWLATTLPSGESQVVELPCLISTVRGITELRLAGGPGVTSDHVHTIESTATDSDRPLAWANILGKAPATHTIARWFEAMGALQHSAAGTTEFYDDAVRFVTDPGGWDAGLVLMREGGRDRTVSSCFTHPLGGIAYCPSLVDQVFTERRTLYHDAMAGSAKETAPSFGDAVAAAPIFDPDGAVTGVIYGQRSLRGRNQRRGIRPLEALWLQLLAGSVTAGIHRQRQEAEAARAVVLFEQAFSPDVAHELLNNPTALAVREQEITVLFADLRNSTRIFEQLGAQAAYDLLSSVLDTLTDEVMRTRGVIIDYYGDGLAAMWNVAEATVGSRLVSLLGCGADRDSPPPIEPSAGARAIRVLTDRNWDRDGHGTGRKFGQPITTQIRSTRDARGFSEPVGERHQKARRADSDWRAHSATVAVRCGHPPCMQGPLARHRR